MEVLGYREVDRKTRYCGVELEMEVRSRAEYDSALESVYDAIPPNVASLKQDSSLDRGFELVTVPMTQKEAEDFFGCITWPKDVYSYKANSTGLHVHISRPRNLTIAKVMYFMNDPANTSWIERLAQRSVNHFAQVSKKKLGDHSSAYRYEIYNTATGGKPTVELRIFKGNLSVPKILRAVQFAFAIHAWADNVSLQALTMESFKAFVKAHRKEYKELATFCDTNRSSDGEDM